MQAIESSNTSALLTCSSLPVLRRNDNATKANSYVQDLQRRLNNFGYSLKVDGFFGKTTENAVKDFQSSNKLKKDGVVGPNTWYALGACVL